MNSKESFIKTIQSGYTFEKQSIPLGKAIYNGEVLSECTLSVPLKTLNRHGLIAGATGTGKTKTLQKIAEGLSENGISVVLMDVKGDLSGIAAPGTKSPGIEERMTKTGYSWSPDKYPVELMNISNKEGVKLRATVLEFGPVLFSKILGLNDTQSGIVSLLFKFSDDLNLPLLNLQDFKSLLNYISNEGKAEVEKQYGKVSSTSVSTILRKVIELEQQGAESFFGEPSFDVNDLIRTDGQGKGYINIINVDDIQDKPKLFSTFMLSLLSEIYATFPEAGDLDKPKLVLFIDEAHLVFDEASKELLQQLENVIKLIRSKGIGIFFCTQNPVDIPAPILGQLGLKIQHALRAFTAADRKQIKLTAENYPITEFYETETLLTSLGIGEAAITLLNEKGIPTPLAACYLYPPKSRMGVLSPDEKKSVAAMSPLVHKYNKDLDSESAHELLQKRIKEEEDSNPSDKKTVENKKSGKKEKSTFEEVMDHSFTKQVGRTVFRELTRGLLGAIGLKR